MEPDSGMLRGKLLIASPSLLDPNFHRTVVLVTEHNDAGAMGLVLNRPSEAAVADAVPPLERLVDDGAHVHVGGPVEPAAVVVLAEFDDPEDAAALVYDDLGFIPGEGDPASFAGTTRRARVFAGYSGWASGQLEAEVQAEAWIVADSEPDDVFDSNADGLWSAVLRRQGGELAVLALMPPDPSVN
jgi:putative transcriptional regulator